MRHSVPSESGGAATETSREMRPSGLALAIRAVVLVLLFSSAAVWEALHLSALAGSQTWLHLSVGEWIVSHFAVPHSGIFSRLSTAPWMDSSWGFDAVLALAYRWLGLRALPLLLMLCRVLIAAATFWLARGWRGNFWSAVILSALAQVLIPSAYLEPVLISVVLLAVELALLFEFQRGRDEKLIRWVVALFIIWASLDGSFVFGLLVLLLMLAKVAADRLLRRDDTTLPLAPLVWTTGGSLMASLISPYDRHVYHAFATIFATRYPYFPLDHGLSFRRPQDYLLLLLAMTACFALGRRRSRDLFRLGLLAGALALAFSRQRDAWVLALASIAIIADALPTADAAPHRKQLRLQAVVAAAVVVVLLVAATEIPRDRDSLLAVVSRSFPVKACDTIRAQRLPAPLFNDYDWGGFLAWYLPDYPVAIDQRADLYGEAYNRRYFELVGGELALDASPEFAESRTILLPRNSPMAVALSAQLQFRVAYQDDVATVLVRQR